MIKFFKREKEARNLVTSIADTLRNRNFKVRVARGIGEPSWAIFSYTNLWNRLVLDPSEMIIDLRDYDHNPTLECTSGNKLVVEVVRKFERVNPQIKFDYTVPRVRSNYALTYEPLSLYRA